MPSTLIDLYLTVGVVTALLILAFALKALTNPIAPAGAAAIAVGQTDLSESEVPLYPQATTEDRELVPA